MDKKTYFKQLCELSYSCTLVNHGYMVREAAEERRRHLGR